MSDAGEFTRIRRILFSKFHQGEQGREECFEWLETTYRDKLGPQGYAGLKAELEIYRSYGKEFQLTVGADVGDHTDFTGVIDGESYRIDVTTNIDYKDLADYEPLQRDQDAKYKILIADTNGNIDDIVDINFPFCPSCNSGRLIDVGVLLPINTNRHGDPNWTNDQVLIGVCNHCEYFEEQTRLTTHFLNDYSTEINNALESDQDRLEYLASQGKTAEFDATAVINDHTTNVLPYLKKNFNKSIVGLGERNYKMTSHDGDGYYRAKMYWRNSMGIFDGYIHDEYEIDLHY